MHGFPPQISKDDLERQVTRLQGWATEQGYGEFEVVTEIGSGLNGKRRRLLRLLKDPEVDRIIVEYRDRLARFGFEMVEAACAAAGRRPGKGPPGDPHLRVWTYVRA